MYEDYSRQALPSKEYRELLGSAICVFNANNSFIIENILRYSNAVYDWSELIDGTSGTLKTPIKQSITKYSDEKIAEQFTKVVNMRNRIIHSFQITEDNGKQILATKDKNDKQFIITEEYLYNFIKENEILSSSLHNLRGF